MKFQNLKNYEGQKSTDRDWPGYRTEQRLYVKMSENFLQGEAKNYKNVRKLFG